MKASTASIVLCFLALQLGAATTLVSGTEGDRAITQVVKLLQSMLKNSKAEGDSERTLYAKFKCYCDTNEAEKKASVEAKTKEIALLESQIEETQEDTGLLSSEVARLKADIAANVAAQAKANSIRSGELTAFNNLKADIDQAVEQMDRAITTLSDVGADQSLSSGADHAQFTAGHGDFVQVQSNLKQALAIASSIVTAQQKTKIQSFIQGPFTATYTAQSGEVVGILKSMRDTFKANLEAATISEAKSLAAHGAFISTLALAKSEMDGSHTSKQSELGSNDGTLSNKKSQLSSAKSTKANDESFLESLLAQCAAKATEYENRVSLRVNEDSAIAQAVSILNSDAAFATFGKTDAATDKTTATGASATVQFLQLAAVKLHTPPADGRQKAKDFLRKAGKSPMFSKLLSLLEVAPGNPFKVILEEVTKMLDIIKKEGDADEDQLSWCNTERTNKDAKLSSKQTQINTLNGEIDTLKDTISFPDTGLKEQIATAEDSLETNLQSQKTETEQRTEENLAYQKDVATLVEAEELIARAIEVLDKYYADILASSLLQKSKEDPAPPSTWTGGADSKSGSAGYQGQSGDGNKALNMLKFILTTTKSEETTAHDDEKTAQHSFEDSMTTHKTNQVSLESSIKTLNEDLADAEEDLLQKQEDLKATEEEHASITNYLASIKNGCDFITTHMDERTTHRTSESAALRKVVGFLEDSSAYKNAEAAQHDDDLGDCLEVCDDNGEAHVKCKACLAKVTVVGYCAGHKATQGC